MKRLTISTLIFLFTISLAGQSTTYYVSLSGNNSNSGTQSSPWRNIQFAQQKLKAGDSLCIGAGIWTDYQDRIDSQTAPLNSGIDFNTPITIGGCNGDKPTIKPPNGSEAVKFTTGAIHHIIVQDLILDGSAAADDVNAASMLYTSNGSHHNRFQRITIQHTMSNGSMFSTNNAPLDAWIQNEILDSIFTDIGNATGDNGHGGPGKNAGYGMYDTSRGNIYRRNKFYENRAFALNIYGSDHIVDSNEFYNVVTRGGGGAALNFGSSAHPIDSENNFATNNYIHDVPNGNGLQFYTNSTSFAYNNTLINIGVTALHIQYCISGEFKNNVFQKNTTDWVNFSPDYCQVTQSNNIFSNVDAKLTSDTDIRPKDKNSPAFNAGVNISSILLDFYKTPRPQANIFDIGAGELVVDTPIPPPSGKTNQIVPLTVAQKDVVTTPTELVDLICYNSNNNTTTVNLYDGTKQLASYTIGANGNLPLTSLDLPFAVSLKANSTRNITCNFATK
jgi:hypothetical protein